jgi:hypothetical protein
MTSAQMTDHGIAPYQGPKAGRPGPRDILALIQRKCAARAELQALQERIDLALSFLDHHQTKELLDLVAAEASDATGPELVQIHAEAEQAAAGIRPLDIKLTRQATAALKSEVFRRLSAGHYCPPTPLLVAEAVRAQYERDQSP